MVSLDDLLRQDGLGILDRMKAGIVFADRDQNILFANQRFTEMFQTDRERIRDMKCSDLLQACAVHCQGDGEREHIFCVRVGGMECHFVMSTTEVGEDIVMRVIQEISRLVDQMTELRRELTELRQRVEATIGDMELVPICGVCHKIRLADGSWVYPGEARDIHLHDGLTHGYCPACAQELIEEFRQSQSEMRRQRLGRSAAVAEESNHTYGAGSGPDGKLDGKPDRSSAPGPRASSSRSDPDGPVDDSATGDPSDTDGS